MGNRWGGGRRLGGAKDTTTVCVTDLMTSLAIIFVLLLVVFVNVPSSAETPVSSAPEAALSRDSGAEHVRSVLQRTSPR